MNLVGLEYTDGGNCVDGTEGTDGAECAARATNAEYIVQAFDIGIWLVTIKRTQNTYKHVIPIYMLSTSGCRDVGKER
jgi:hypothetical protein